MNSPETVLPMLISQNDNFENKQYSRETVRRLICQNIENNEHTRNSIANNYIAKITTLKINNTPEKQCQC